MWMLDRELNSHTSPEGVAHDFERPHDPKRVETIGDPVGKASEGAILGRERCCSFEAR